MPEEITETPKKKTVYGTPIPKAYNQFRFCNRCREWKTKDKCEVVCMGKYPVNTPDAKEEYENMCLECIEEVLDGIKKNES